LAVLIGSFGPEVYKTQEVSSWQCPDDTQEFSYSCAGVNLAREGQVWIGQIDGLSELNQELILSAIGHNKLYRDEGIDMELEWVISMYGSSQQDPEKRTPSNTDQSQNTVWRTIVTNDKTIRRIECFHGESECESITLIHEPYIGYTTYQFEVSLDSGDSTLESAERALGDILFEFRYVNAGYTQFEVWWRFAFLLASFGMIVLFSHQLRTYKFSEWMIEQQYTGMLLVALVTYNNPIYPLVIVVNSWFPSFVNQLFTLSFICALLFFWLVTFDGLRKQEPGQRRFTRFYLPKIVFVGSIWLCGLIVYTWIEVHQLDDPEYAKPQDFPGFLVFSIAFALLSFMYLIRLGTVVVLTFSNMFSLPYLSNRVKFLGIFTLFVVLLTVGGLIFDWLAPDVNSAAGFLTYIALFNFYIFVLTVCYLPAKSGMPDKSTIASYQITAYDVLDEEEPLTSQQQQDDDDSEGSSGGVDSTVAQLSLSDSHDQSYTYENHPTPPPITIREVIDHSDDVQLI